MMRRRSFNPARYPVNEFVFVAILFGQILLSCGPCASPASAQITPAFGTAPFAYFKMDESSGVNAFDSAGTNTGVATTTTIIPGVLGNARSLNCANGDYIN